MFLNECYPVNIRNIVLQEDRQGVISMKKISRASDGKEEEAVNREMRDNLDTEVTKSMKTTRKKSLKKTYLVAAVIVGIFITVCVLLHFFPFYHIFGLEPLTKQGYYTSEKIAAALHIGSASDRREVQAVLQLADKAFNDTQHTSAENKEEYGELARYATATDYYGDVAFNEHSLELWSVHLGKNEGWMWVYYSSETFDHDGTTVCGSWHIPSLWKVERDDDGEWVVVKIFEHP